MVIITAVAIILALKVSGVEVTTVCHGFVSTTSRIEKGQIVTLELSRVTEENKTIPLYLQALAVTDCDPICVPQYEFKLQQYGVYRIKVTEQQEGYFTPSSYDVHYLLHEDRCATDQLNFAKIQFSTMNRPKISPSSTPPLHCHNSSSDSDYADKKGQALLMGMMTGHMIISVVMVSMLVVIMIAVVLIYFRATQILNKNTRTHALVGTRHRWCPIIGIPPNGFPLDVHYNEYSSGSPLAGSPGHPKVKHWMPIIGILAFFPRRVCGQSIKHQRSSQFLYKTEDDE